MEKYYQILFCGIDKDNKSFQQIIVISKCLEYVEHYVATFNKVYPNTGKLVIKSKISYPICEKEITTEEFKGLINRCKKRSL